MIHDFCGGLEEEILRTNFILVYELIDEMIVLFFVANQQLGLWTSVNYKSRNFENFCLVTS